MIFWGILTGAGNKQRLPAKKAGGLYKTHPQQYRTVL